MADYVSNKELFAEMCIYRAAYFEALEQNKPLPAVSDKIASAIDRIAHKLSNSWNFINYTFKDEMVGDAMLRCLIKAHKFDPTRSENPFAYFSQISWNCFIERIKIEQYETSVKAKYIKEKMSHEFVEHGTSLEGEDSSNSFVEFLKENDIFIDHIEEKKKNTIHESLRHKNKTEYIKKVEVYVEPEMDLTQFEE
jgi:DNA-directed RNA polymerase specialized sigma24 family protein